MMQYPMYASYPCANVYPVYNAYFGTGCSLGQAYGNYYGYQPWMTSRWNPTMMMQQNGKSEEEIFSGFMKNNMMYLNRQHISPQYAYSPYNLYQYPWNTPFALTTWLSPRQTYNQMIPWGSYYNYDKWTPTPVNLNSGLYYSWPMMNYYSNHIMYPNYLSPSPTNWGVQQTIEMPHSESNHKKSTQRPSPRSTALNVTSSDVIRDFNLPPVVAKKTRSDIPRPSVDCTDIKGSELSKEEMDLPYLFRVSDTSIQQIAPSRSFGPSMVYNTESDNKPSSAHW